MFYDSDMYMTTQGYCHHQPRIPCLRKEKSAYLIGRARLVIPLVLEIKVTERVEQVRVAVPVQHTQMHTHSNKQIEGRWTGKKKDQRFSQKNKKLKKNMISVRRLIFLASPESLEKLLKKSLD
jgi:hypothetical protein